MRLRHILLAATLLMPVAALAQSAVGSVPVTQKGAPGGVMPLDGTAKAPIGNLPIGLTSTTVPSGDLLASESSTARSNEASITSVQFVAGAGTTQTGATPITAPTVYITSGVASSGILLVAAIKNARIVNTLAVAILVYPPSSGTINGGAANTAVQLPAGGSARFASPDGAAWSAG